MSTVETQRFGKVVGKLLDPEKGTRRAEERRAIRQRGCIRFDRTANAYPCLINDLSPHGARIEMLAAVPVPRSFWLELEPDGELLRSELRWRIDGNCGVRFKDH